MALGAAQLGVLALPVPLVVLLGDLRLPTWGVACGHKALDGAYCWCWLDPTRPLSPLTLFSGAEGGASHGWGH